jgi:hypothetical protein
MNLALQSNFVHNSKAFLACHKILRHGVDGLTSPPTKDVLRICIALKNPSPRPFLNPRTLCSMAITLTITPQRNIHRPMEVVTTSVRLHDATSQKRRLPYDLMNCCAVFITEKSCLSVRMF